ncbi:hypothetical protein [Roseburia lenta]|nr:hypothetical protein [Roseburia lenta]
MRQQTSREQMAGRGQGMGWCSMRAANLGAGYVSLFEKGFA